MNELNFTNSLIVFLLGLSVCRLALRGGGLNRFFPATYNLDNTDRQTFEKHRRTGRAPFFKTWVKKINLAPTSEKEKAKNRKQGTCRPRGLPLSRSDRERSPDFSFVARPTNVAGRQRIIAFIFAL